jgi:hypothetical protein
MIEIPKDIPNRRLIKRFDLMLPAVIKLITNEESLYSQLGLTKDVSSKGTFIWLTEPIPNDAKIEVQMLCPLSYEVDRFEYVQITAIGCAVRREENGLAVNFDEKATLKPFHIEHKKNYSRI